jgi:hypothetical protein
VNEAAQAAYGDPLSQPFWAAAARHELVVQRCAACGHHQFYPRPYCLKCESDRVEWVKARGTGTVYTMTVVHMAPAPGFAPPYVAAVVELDEGPRLTTNLVEGEFRIGDAVEVTWRARDGAPPVPVFRPRSGG